MSWRWNGLAAVALVFCGSVAQRAFGKTETQVATPSAAFQTQQQTTDNWLAELQKRVAAHNLEGAKKVVQARLAAAPEDSDALDWLAKLLAWTGHRGQAESAYRQALQVSPHDADCFLGLATLLAQEGRNVDALALLDAAVQIPPPRADIYNERGRVLAALGRRNEARTDFLKARALEPGTIAAADDEAAAGLRSLELPLRFEIDFTNETDTFNYTGAANAQAVVFIAKPNDRWTFLSETDSYQRFGVSAQKDIAAAAHRFPCGNWLTIGAGAGNAQGIIPSAEAYFEYDRGFRLSEHAPLRAVEASYNQHWLWYRGAHVLVLTGTVAAGLARGYRWTFSANEARSGFAGTRVAWEPSGYSRLEFPLPRVRAGRLLANVTFAVGSENFSELDQVSAFASRTYSGGFRLGFTERQFANFYFGRQDRNGGRSAGIYGASYGIRF
ncbi:MAG TPA: tetratricopeptide repeat protein [Candidatus Acidoferrales bacterium]|nr:tetratricopeptide repeat protein [Candidatus Acidoferrales bacterium]